MIRLMIFQSKNILLMLVAFICAGCQNNKKSSKELIENAQKYVDQKQYMAAANELFTVCNREPNSTVGKNAGRDAAWLALNYLLETKFQHPKFIQPIVFNIITACSLIIAVDKEYAMKHDLHICKIFAQCLMIRPYPDFDRNAFNAVKQDINKNNALAIAEIQKSCNEYVNDVHHIGINADISEEEIVVAQIRDFIEYMEHASQYLQILVNKEINQDVPSLSHLHELDQIKAFSGTSRALILTLRTLLLKLQILAEINLNIEYLDKLYTEMENSYNSAFANKIISRKEHAEQCDAILREARSVLEYARNCKLDESNSDKSTS